MEGIKKKENTTTKSQYFPHYDDHITRLNTGSLGAVAGPALAAQRHFQESFLADTGPQRYHFTGRLGPEIAESLGEVTGMFVERTTPDWQKKWCFVQNATTAAAIVAHHWGKASGTCRQGREFLVTTDCIFGPVKRCFAEHMPHVEVIVLRLLEREDGAVSLPQNRNEILARFEKQWSVLEAQMEGCSDVYCCLEYIPCLPPVLLPLALMLARIRRSFPNVHTFVDAAQAFLYPDFSFTGEFGGPDFAVVNLYKWNCAPVGTSVLYVGEEGVSHVIPSWEGDITEGGWYTGLRDYSAYVAAKHAIRFMRDWRSDQGEAAQQYCKRNLVQAVGTLTAAWTSTINYTPNPDSLGSSMAMVPLPASLPPLVCSDGSSGTREDAGLDLRGVLREKYGIEVKVAKIERAGQFVRISFAVFNTQEDVWRLRDAVLDIVKSSCVRENEF